LCIYIGIEDLAANALIEIIRRDESRRQVSFDILAKYGMQVIRFLQEKNKSAVLILSRERQLSFVRDYSDFFSADFSEGDGGVIRLREGVCKKDLLVYFRAAMPLDCIDAFVNDEALKELGVPA